MLYYHGTTKRVAKQILKKGLKPHRESAYDIEVDSWFGRESLREAFGEDKEVVYLTPKKQRAELYAGFRARYEMAHKGDLVVFHPMVANQYKKAESCQCKEEPVVIVFDIPQYVVETFEVDPQDRSQAYTCACTIPPTYVVGVLPAPLGPPPADEELL